MNNLIIRKAREDELKVVQGLNQQLFEYDGVWDETLNMEWVFSEGGEKYFRDKISGKEGVCFVAEIGGEVVGYLAGGMYKPYFYRTVKKMTELENVLVKEEFRGQNIGEKLFGEFLKWSKQRGAERIAVYATAQNSRAIKFYEKVGFKTYSLELELVVD
jgi:diamine N-acetyltransferase